MWGSRGQGKQGRGASVHLSPEVSVPARCPVLPARGPREYTPSAEWPAGCHVPAAWRQAVSLLPGPHWPPCMGQGHRGRVTASGRGGRTRLGPIPTPGERRCHASVSPVPLRLTRGLRELGDTVVGRLSAQEEAVLAPGRWHWGPCATVPDAPVGSRAVGRASGRFPTQQRSLAVGRLPRVVTCVRSGVPRPDTAGAASLMHRSSDARWEWSLSSDPTVIVLDPDGKRRTPSPCPLFLTLPRGDKRNGTQGCMRGDQ